jgi:hypothetical protein
VSDGRAVRHINGAGYSGRAEFAGDPDEVYFEETDTNFAIGWKGNYQIDGEVFIYIDSDTARITTILGYPPAASLNWGDREISNIFA